MSIEFLRTEVETAFAFIRIAADAANTEKKSRNAHHARRGYETLVHFTQKLVLTADERAEFQQQISELRQRLVDLGEKV